MDIEKGQSISRLPSKVVVNFNLLQLGDMTDFSRHTIHYQ